MTYVDIEQQAKNKKCESCGKHRAVHWIAYADDITDWDEIYCLKCFVNKLDEMHDMYHDLLEGEK